MMFSFPLQVTREGEETELRARGRHDACVVPRAVPMVESMVALVLADQLLQHYAQVGGFCVCSGKPAQWGQALFLGNLGRNENGGRLLRWRKFGSVRLEGGRAVALLLAGQVLPHPSAVLL